MIPYWTKKGDLNNFLFLLQVPLHLGSSPVHTSWQQEPEGPAGDPSLGLASGAHVQRGQDRPAAELELGATQRGAGHPTSDRYAEGVGAATTAGGGQMNCQPTSTWSAITPPAFQFILMTIDYGI